MTTILLQKIINQIINMKNLTNITETEKYSMCYHDENSHRRGKIAGGILIVTIGSLFLAKELGVDLPHWLFSWKTLLIGFGLVSGIKHNFRNRMWMILVIVGSTFLLGDIYPDLIMKRFLWPIIFILIGLAMIFKPRSKNGSHFFKYWGHKPRYQYNQENNFSNTTSNNEDSIDSTVFFGGVKKNIISKNFKGGNIVVAFSGIELNLMQADLAENAVLEVTTAFGGTKILAPANWEIKSEIECVFGSVEDKRPIHQSVNNAFSKTLILKGTVFCGGIDIRSY